MGISVRYGWETSQNRFARGQLITQFTKIKKRKVQNDCFYVKLSLKKTNLKRVQNHLRLCLDNKTFIKRNVNALFSFK